MKYINKKYINKIRVLQVVETCEQGVEQDVFIEIAGKRLKCFWSLGDKEFTKGETAEAKLALMTTDRKKIETEKKEIKTKYQRGTPNRCNLKGQIVAIYNNPNPLGYNYAVVDCDKVFIEVEFSSKDDFKIEDYIEAEGRLDISKIEIYEIMNNG